MTAAACEAVPSPSGRRWRDAPDEGAPSPRGRKQGGFTLIEILVAVAILAIALGAIISGMTRYASNAGYLKQKTIALWVAHNRLTELELEPGWPAEGKSDGETEMGGAKWKWLAEVKKTPDDRLRRVDLRVQLAGTEGDLATLTSFISDAGRQQP